MQVQKTAERLLTIVTEASGDGRAVSYGTLLSAKLPTAAIAR